VAFSAVLDACVLYPVGVRDLLLSVADRAVYMPRWTEEILDEMDRNVVKDGRSTPEAMAKMRAQMNIAFPAAGIDGYEALVSSMTNHPKDRHVLAAAVRANVGVIVTENRKDFPPAACDPYDIEIHSADEFLSYALDHDPPTVIGAVHTMAIRRRRPPIQARQLLAALHDRLPTFCHEALSILDSIDPSGIPTT
jgi:hypothetical protein